MAVLDECDPAMIQRMAALSKANDHRVRRAQFKRELRASRTVALEVLMDPPEWAASMSVIDLLVAIPRVGRIKASGWLRRASVSPNVSLARLTARQRGEVATAIMMVGRRR